MRIVIAPQEYKGTLTASQAADAIAEGARRALPDADLVLLPLADGGPGTVDAIVHATGGSIRRARVHGPLLTPVDASWGLLDDGTAVIEMAAAAGLLLVPKAERDPRITTTCGVGELIRTAVDAGCRRIIVGVGGSATNDGGAGMAQALGVRLLDAEGRDLPPGGAVLTRLARIDASGLDARVAETELVAAIDAMNPLCGPEGSSLVYSPQKGATPEMAAELDAALRHYAGIIERDVGISVLDARGADVVITGEGRLDGQTGWGKTMAGVARIAAAEGVPVIAVPGSLGDGWESVRSLFAALEAASGKGPASERLAVAVERALRDWAA